MLGSSPRQLPARDHDPVIATQLVPIALAYATAKGVDTSALRASFSLGFAGELETIRLPLSRIAIIVECIAEVVGDPHLGLTLAEVVTRGAGGVGELAARSAPTVGAAIERLARYARIIPPHQELTTSRDGRELRLSTRASGGDEPPFTVRHANEFAVGRLYRLACELAGSRPRVLRVWFSHRAESNEMREAYERHFGTPNIAFDRDFNEIAFDPELADWPVPARDDAMLRVLDAYAASLLPATSQPTDARRESLEKVKNIVAELLVDGVPDLPAVARRLGVGERTLQRQLQAQGTSLSALVDHLRRSLAIRHLQTSSVSVNEIAFVLGYSGGRAFARAFERWTGMTPTEFRGDTEN